jgi:hypothetical protein
VRTPEQIRITGVIRQNGSPVTRMAAKIRLRRWLFKLLPHNEKWICAAETFRKRA